MSRTQRVSRDFNSRCGLGALWRRPCESLPAALLKSVKCGFESHHQHHPARHFERPCRGTVTVNNQAARMLEGNVFKATIDAVIGTNTFTGLRRNSKQDAGTVQKRK